MFVLNILFIVLKIKSHTFYLNKIGHDRSGWNGANCLCITRGESNEDDLYLKSIIVQEYLFGYQLPDTLLLLTEDGNCTILSTKKKCEFLSAAVGQAPTGSSIVDVMLLERNKGDNNAKNHSLLMKEMTKNQKNGEKIKIGILTKEWTMNEETKCPIVSGWQKDIDSSDSVEMVDISTGLGLSMAVKDDVEQDLMKKSAILSNKVLKHAFIPKLEEIIDQEKIITHEDLATEIEQVIEDPSKIKIKVPVDIVSSAYFPIIQSGGEYDLKPSAQPTSKPLKYDIITVSLGARYQRYCSNITRTFLIDPPKTVSETYDTLIAVQDACIAAMIPGNQLKQVYAAAVKTLKSLDRDDLVSTLPKNLGFAMGMDFRESALVLSPKNNNLFRPGMYFNLQIGFGDVPLSDKAKASVSSNSAIKALDKYSLVAGDTILITEKNAEALTKHSKGVSDISYTINDDDAQSTSTPEAPDGDEKLARELERKFDRQGGNRISARLANNRDANVDNQAGAVIREKKQVALMNRRNEERVRELARAKSRDNGDGSSSEKAEELETYKRTRDYPDNVLPNQVKVDMTNQCVLLPVGGNPVPFHISTIKGVNIQPDGSVTYLRINFYTAGMALGKDASLNVGKLVEKYAPYASFIREMTFRSLDPANLTQAFRLISELKKRFKQKELVEQEEANLVKQDKLIRTKNERVPRLSDLTMRPVFAGRKAQGNIEAHTNGLRFVSTSSSRGESVDIIYDNIKYAFFQPCENEIMVLIHFYLKNPIMIGKKKTSNIQFFTEVIDASQAVDTGRRNMYDPDEMDDEQRERQLRKKLNDAFRDFCQKVEKIAAKNGFAFEFDVPYRDLGFHGTPNKEMVFIIPTLNCVVNLTETPFFVVDLGEVDHVHFERISYASKAFDMVLINKDFSKQPWRVDMIPHEEKDSIQEWLTDMDITYTQGPMNLNWKSIMATVAEDDRFYLNTEEDEFTEKEAGWSFLRVEGGDDDTDEDSAVEDSDFSEEAVNESESEEEESEFDEEESEESDYDADEDLEEQGMDWEDMEKEAMADDKRKNRRQAEEEEDVRRSTKRNASRPSSNANKRSRR